MKVIHGIVTFVLVVTTALLVVVNATNIKDFFKDKLVGKTEQSTEVENNTQNENEPTVEEQIVEENMEA